MSQSIINTEFMMKAMIEIIKYVPVTMSITIVSMIFAFIIAFTTAMVRIYKVPVLKNIFSIYISFTRGTPLLVQMYLAYYGIPKVLDFMHINYGWNINVNMIPAIYFVYFAFSFNVGAYFSETIRAAIAGVDKGQIEAALSVGMSPFQGMIRVVFPQAFTIIVPNLGNTLIGLLKDTSLAFIISVVDIMGQAKIVGARGLNFFEAYIAVAIIYWIICMSIEFLVSKVEKRVRIYEGGYR